MQRPGGLEGPGTSLPTPTSPPQTASTSGSEGLPRLRVCYLSLVSGPRHTGSPALSSGPIVPGNPPQSFSEQQCPVMPSMIVPVWPLPAPGRMASKCLSQLVSNNIQTVCHKPSSPRCPGPQVPRQRLAQATPSCCPSTSRGPRGCWWLRSVSFTLRKQRKRQLVPSTSSRAEPPRWLSGSLPVSCRHVPSARAHRPLA